MAVAVAASAASITALVLTLSASADHDLDSSHSAHGLWNDFYSYWGAGRLLNQGGNPYDQQALRAVYAQAGVHPEVGSGFSYPLAFAQLMRPLALLPPQPAALLLSALSLLCLGTAVALLLDMLPPVTPRQAMACGTLIGLAPPVAGSLYVGQANLIILAPLALAHRQIRTGAALALAGSVKLFPTVGLVALGLRGRRHWPEVSQGLLILLALLVLPALAAPQAAYTARLDELIAPDPYWTNASLNGVVSRLAIPFGGISPPLAGLPVATTVAWLTAALAMLGLALLVSRRASPWDLSLALALLLGLVLAPKNSVWNWAPLLLAVVAAWPPTRQRPALRRALLAAIVLVEAGTAGVFLTLLPAPSGTWRLLPGLAALLGVLLLVAVLAQLLIHPPQSEPSPEAGRPPEGPAQHLREA